MTEEASQPHWYHERWAVLLLLFVVLGPLALPLLWRSPRFTRGWKIALSLAVAVYTLLLADSTLVATRLVLERLAEARAH